MRFVKVFFMGLTLLMTAVVLTASCLQTYKMKNPVEISVEDTDEDETEDFDDDKAYSSKLIVADLVHLKSKVHTVDIEHHTIVAREISTPPPKA